MDGKAPQKLGAPEEGNGEKGVLAGDIVRRDQITDMIRVSYQIIDHFAVEQTFFCILEIQVPANAAHGDWIDVYDAFTHVACGIRIRLPGLVVHRDIFASVKTLAGVKTCRRGIPSHDRPKKRV